MVSPSADVAVATFLASATIGQAMLAATLLLLRSRELRAYLPLAGLFIALAIVALPPLTLAWPAQPRAMVVVLLLPAYLALGPLFWLYVVALTQPTPWRPRWRDIYHFLPFALALVVATLAALLPADTLRELIIEGNDASLFSPDGSAALTPVGYLVVTAFILILAWLVQSALYLFFVLRRLFGYRRQLKALFASNERRELGWVVGIVVTVGGIWMVSATSLVLENFAATTILSTLTRSLAVALFVFLLAVWGLRQKPGFEGRYLDPEASEASAKYERSALGSEQARALAERIDRAMVEDKLYLKPGLSLAALAKHVGTLPNYVSQTLNERLQSSFFDYVNRHRIEAAKPLVVDGNDAIIDVAYAVGFNSRSAFYTAFRKVTGQTPGAYRKAK